MQFSQPLRLPSHFMKPIPAMTLCYEAVRLHQATLALDRRNTSPPMPRLHTQQLTQMLITLYICGLPPIRQVYIAANRGSEGALRATLATYVLERGWQDIRIPAAQTPLAGNCENAGQTFTALCTWRSTIVS